MPLVLVVDDEPNIRRMLGRLLESEGYRVREAGDGLAALRQIDETEPDVLLLDLMLPGMDGLAVLQEVAARWPALPVVMMSGRATLSDAVRATKLGAFHFIEKPLTPEAVLLTIHGAVELKRARELSRTLAADLGPGDRLVGSSAVMARLREMLGRVAQTDARVLLTGESGTGKEVIARALHDASPRAERPFVAVNCAALPETLLESELFGHERGAFTGAHQAQKGRFEAADGGTLFLDEIGELPMSAQVKLLRAIQERRFERVGGRRTLSVDVRLVAATNADLEEAVRVGQFRLDLYHRLQVVELRLPALRERREDVPLLARHLLAELCAEHGREVTLTPDALEALQAASWPGNVRQLRNVLERLVVAHPGAEVRPADLWPILGEAPLEPELPPAAEAEGHGLVNGDAAERARVNAALVRAGYVKARAARLLGMSVRQLTYRVQKYGIAVERF